MMKKKKKKKKKEIIGWALLKTTPQETNTPKNNHLPTLAVQPVGPRERDESSVERSLHVCFLLRQLN